MSSGLSKTLRVLARSPNKAAVRALACALESSDTKVREGAVRAIARRREKTGHLVLIRKFDTLTDAECAAIADSGRMRLALRDALLSGETNLVRSACGYILRLGQFRLLPALVEAARRSDKELSAHLAATLVKMCHLLHEAPSLIAGRPVRRDAYFVRRETLLPLARELDHLPHRLRADFVEALLLLAGHDHPVLLRVLEDTTHPCHAEALQCLRTSRATGIIRLLTSFLCDACAPQLVLDVIAERSEPDFLAALLRGVSLPLTPLCRQNAKRMRNIRWAEEHRSALMKLEERAQAAAVDLVAASSLARSEVFSLAQELLEQGRPQARSAACRALGGLPGAASNALLVRALDDAESAVRCAAAQPRIRHMPGMTPKLIEMLDDPSPEVRHAVQKLLEDINFVRYRSAFDKLDEKGRRKVGQIVCKSDPKAVSSLAQLLSSPSPTTRLEGIELAVAMELAEPLSEELAGVTGQGDVEVRVEALRALWDCRSDEARDAFESARSDQHPAVREAAEEGLRRRGQLSDGELEAVMGKLAEETS